MSELTFKFEEQLKKFIEENCGYDFAIEIKKDASGIHIENAVNKAAIYSELETIDDMLIEMSGYDRETEQIDLEDNITLACDNIRDSLEGE